MTEKPKTQTKDEIEAELVDARARQCAVTITKHLMEDHTVGEAMHILLECLSVVIATSIFERGFRVTLDKATSELQRRTMEKKTTIEEMGL